jgi:hypothetical protein
MTISVAELIERVRTILQDTTSIRWTKEELTNWLNDSYREIINIRPDANSVSATFTCAQNSTRQSLVTGTLSPAVSPIRLLDVTRNITSGRAIRHVQREPLDDTRRAWHKETGPEIEHFMFDPRLPREFFVYPAPSGASHQIEVVISSVPAGHTYNSSTGAWSAANYELIDSFANASLDYVLYRAYSKDAEYAANAQRAVAHFQAMQNALGLKTQSDIATNPQDLGDRTVR